jgi:NTE family protein
MQEFAEALPAQDAAVYDHRRLTTLLVDHDIPEHYAAPQSPPPGRTAINPRRENSRDERVSLPALTSASVPRQGAADGPLTAFVLSGGGSLGAVQVGMLRALLQAGIRPDLVVGSSIGALNGAFLAGHLDLDGVEAMEKFWFSVQRREVFRISPRDLVRGTMGSQNHLFSHLGLRSLITRADLGFSRLEDAPFPVHVVATDLFSGEPVVLSQGDAVEALLASAAIPGIYSPVMIDGRTLIDGGVVANVPVRQALELGAKRLFVLPAIFDGRSTTPSSALDMMQHTTMIATAALARRELQQAALVAELHVLPLPDYAAPSMFDFGETSELIESAYQASSAWVRDLMPASRPDAVPRTLTNHNHQPTAWPSFTARPSTGDTAWDRPRAAYSRPLNRNRSCTGSDVPATPTSAA